MSITPPNSTSASHQSPSSPASSLRILYPTGASFQTALYASVFNARHPSPPRRPTGIAYPTSIPEIQACVRLAIEKNWRISVRSGGHSWAVWSVRDGALCVDLGAMRKIAMVEGAQAGDGHFGDVADKGMGDREHIVAVTPAVTGKELNDFLMERGRMFPGGHCPDVGLGGFLLQGGMGWNAKGWGWACEYMVAADVVTAKGEAIRCSTKENADLFWAIRGAGPGCPCIVTTFYLKTRPTYPAMYSSTYIYPLSEYDIVMDWIVKISPAFDTDTEIAFISTYTSPSSPSPNLIALFTTFKHALSDATAALLPAETFHPPNSIHEAFCKPTSLDDEYASQRRAAPLNHRYATDNIYLSNNLASPTSTHPMISTLKSAFTSLPTRKSYSLYLPLAPTSRRPLPSMALSLQSDHYIALYATWEDSQDDQRCQTWLRESMKSIEGQSLGSYLGDADFSVRKTRFWAAEEGSRLREVRRKWDGEGRICGFCGAEGDELNNELESKSGSEVEEGAI